MRFALFASSASVALLFSGEVFAQASSGFARGSCDKANGIVCVGSNGKANPTTLPVASGGVPYSAVIGGSGTTPNVAGLDSGNLVPVASLHVNAASSVPIYTSGSVLALIGDLEGSTATFSGTVKIGTVTETGTATNTFAGPINGTSETLTGVSTAASFNGTASATSSFAGSIIATSETLSGNLGVATINASGPINSSSTQTSTFAGPIVAPGFSSPGTGSAAFGGPVTAPSFATSGAPNTVTAGTFTANGSGTNMLSGPLSALTISTTGTGSNTFDGPLSLPTITATGSTTNVFSGPVSVPTLTDSGGITSTSTTVPDSIAGNIVVSGGSSSQNTINGYTVLGTPATNGSGVSILGGLGIAPNSAGNSFNAMGNGIIGKYLVPSEIDITNPTATVAMTTTTTMLFMTSAVTSPINLQLDANQPAGSTVDVPYDNGSGSTVTLRIFPAAGYAINDGGANNQLSISLVGGIGQIRIHRATSTSSFYRVQ